MPKVTIIIPVYNVENYIEKCARSLFEQSLDELEFLFVDDGSTDRSIKILENIILKYPKRINQIHIFRQENKGVSVARNKGLEEATSDYVAFCDSDDWVLPDMYETLYNKAISSDADIVYCDFYMHYGDDKNKIYKTISPSKDKIKFLRDFMSSYTTLCNILAKRDLFMEYKLCFPSHIIYREDFYLSIRLYYYAKIIEKVHTPFYYYNRLNENSALHNRTKRQVNDELICDLDIISFFTKEKVIDAYKDKLSWGILRDKQCLIWDSKRHKEFLSIYPESHKYILNCPLICAKVKCMMWLLTHHLRCVAVGINWLRNMRGKRTIG